MADNGYRYLYVDLIKVESWVTNQVPSQEDKDNVADSNLNIYRISTFDGYIEEMDVDGEFQEVQNKYSSPE